MKNQWRKNLIIAWIGCFFTGSSISLVMPFIPVYVEQLGTPKNQIELFSGLAISVTAFAFAIVAPLWGNLADRKRRKIMMIRADAGMTFAMGALAFVTTPLELGILRFILGFSTGALIPSINTLISKITPVEGVSRVYSYNQMFSNFGQVLGPMVGSTVAHAFNYSAVFIVTSLFVLANVFLALVNFRKVLHQKL